LILGIGTDLCSIARLTQAIERTPNLKPRLFATGELQLPMNSLAARFAAKEALAKALGDPSKLVWNEIEVVNGELGKPEFVFHGATATYINSLNCRVHLSLSHELELASAMVVVEAI
jgi:holo-[acyl-carrier protein] synthase